ncbi:hypothetical protein PAEPH01_1995 [Pancytospora epiphaga]|nr:hypothetical protein PAEPH01_1995 [Pancytospora epiphaga]
MENTDELSKRLEEHLKTMQAAEEKLNELASHLMNLEAHRRTLVSCLAGTEQSTDRPSPIPSNGSADVIESRDISEFYVLNLGVVIPPSTKGQLIFMRCPNGYRTIRKFTRHHSSLSSHREIFYTTTALLGKKGWHYIIKDDENNVCEGANAFLEFRKWFGGDLPFRNIEEWLGLYNPEIWNRIMVMG